MAERFDSFRFPLAIDPGLGTLRVERDYERHVAQLIQQVLLTSPGERVHRPDFGAGLRRLVFAPANEATASLIQTTVLQSLERWLAEVIRVEDVQVDFGTPGRADVMVAYTIRARGTRRVLNLEVTA